MHGKAKNDKIIGCRFHFSHAHGKLVPAASAGSNAIINVQASLFINGHKIDPGAPIKKREGTIIVPLKSLLKPLGLTLIWNTENKGYRINTYDSVLLLMPQSKLTYNVAIHSGNLEMDDILAYQFIPKLSRMPVPLTEQGGIQYIPLKWLCAQLGLSLSVQGGNLRVQGDVESIAPSQQHLLEVYNAVARKFPDDPYFYNFESFLKQTYNYVVDGHLNELENSAITANLGKTIWLYNKADAADLNTNAGITIPRFSEVKIVDEYAPDECVIQYKNKRYIVKTYLIDKYYNQNPQKLVKMSAKTWEAVKNERVLVGMSFAEVLLAWGEPTDEYKTSLTSGMYDHWYYGDSSYVLFKNGRVVSIHT